MKQKPLPWRASQPKRRGAMEKDNVSIDVYKKLICDMIQEMNDVRFIRQIYSIVYRQKKRTGG